MQRLICALNTSNLVFEISKENAIVLQSDFILTSLAGASAVV